MDNIDIYRSLMESVENVLEADDEELENEFPSDENQENDENSVDTDDDSEYDDSQDEEQQEEQEPIESINSIMTSIKKMVDVLSGDDEAKIAELKSGLNDLSLDFNDLCDTVCGLDECDETDSMKPALVKNVETYDDPNGQSYAARNGFVG